MTHMFSKRMIGVVMVFAVASYAMEASAAPIRSGVSRARSLSPRQRGMTRAQANRAFRLAAKSGIPVSAASLTGFKGASSISTAALSPDTSPTAATITTASTAPTLQQVWESLAPTMRFASQLQPDPGTGLLPGTPFVTDLQARRAVNQARFDTYHPQIAQLMDWDSTIRNSGSPSGLNPAGKPSTTNPQVVIPEPSTIVIALSLVGFAAWTRRTTLKTCSEHDCG